MEENRQDMGSGGQDDRLLEQAGQGDEKAFAQLVERHADRVFSLALRVVGSDADAEDVAQEVFLTVWRHAADWRPGKARFSTWLYRVTLNLSLNHRERVVTRHAALDAVAEPEDPAPTQEKRLDERRRKERVMQAVAALPEGQSIAMTLIYEGGLSNAEAASTMGISVKALEALLVRARRKLRKMMAR
ncbi:sigma-70 family RNA polymerase sigma factor [Marinobacter sp.]|uniref:sigma-70 family RNA polymerase sigma factor n=1 Tax=Marinobacter sp. TaxID=50741 RepID=UPI0025C2103B|nr:sigma-70 family RNA polymerase sigma factor [Marinobacter sp.]MDY6816941.1 sigma-70 family RNA polymerase sigma factor [Pseudomonadota bacterium]